MSSINIVKIAKGKGLKLVGDESLVNNIKKEMGLAFFSGSICSISKHSILLAAAKVIYCLSFLCVFLFVCVLDFFV
jgi:hypothetical protein